MKVVIVGGVAGGAGAAARLRRNDESAQIVLLERDNFISFANCGLPYYIGGVIKEREELLLQTPEGFRQRFNVDVRVMHEVTAVDAVAKTVTVTKRLSGESYVESYDALILSPGARPVTPPIVGAHGADGALAKRVYTLRNMDDCMAIAAHVRTRHPRCAAVIGAGFVGLEMADNLHREGVQVSVIEAMPHVMGVLDQDMSAEVHNHLREKGIDLHLQATAREITAQGVVLADGREIPADMIIMSVGVAPDTAFLASSGIERGKRGDIVVDARLRTSLPDVYAVGDAVSVMNILSGERQMVALAGPANKQARIVADVVCGLDAVYTGTQGTAIAKVFDMTVAVTGLNEAALRQSGRAYLKSVTLSPSHASYYPGGEPMTVKLMFHPHSGRLYGAQITGRGGVDKRIDVLATAVRHNLTVFDLQELELAYAPPFSSAKDPVNMAGYVAGNIVERRSKPLYVEELAQLGPDSVLVDVRTTEEYGEGHIPGSINIPLDSLRERLSELDRAKTVCITCQIGLRGHIAEEILRHCGFNVRNLMGGYRFYAQAAAAGTVSADQSHFKV